MFTIICHWSLSTVICPIFVKMYQNIILLSVPSPSSGFLKLPNQNYVSNSSSVPHPVQSLLRNCGAYYETFSFLLLLPHSFPWYLILEHLQSFFLSFFSFFLSFFLFTLTLNIQPFKFQLITKCF